MYANVLEIFENGALRHFPDKRGICCRDRSVNFRELDVLSKRCAWKIYETLRSLDIGEDILRPIAVLLPRGIEAIVADLGITYSCNIYTNLDIGSPDQRLLTIVDQLDVSIVITDDNGYRRLSTAGLPEDRLLHIEEAIHDGVSCDESMICERLASIIDTDPFCIINTSGSTGRPKSATISHKGMIDYVDWIIKQLGLNENSTIGNLSPFFFDLYMAEFQVCLATGAEFVVLPEQMSMFPVRLLEYMKRTEVNFILWVPTTMVNIAKMKVLDRIDMSGLKIVCFAGEVFPIKHLNYWRRRLPHAMFVNLYGPIEATVTCTYYVVDRELKTDEPLPIGFPNKNSDVLILSESDRLASSGEYGELCIRGSSVALGYWNDVHRTREAFVQNPLNGRYRDIIYRTGDLVYRIGEGPIIFVGRKDLQVKHLGYRIELPEIEQAMLNLSFVENACVFYSAREKAIVGVYEAEVQQSAVEMHNLLSKVLPKYMIPKTFRWTEHLPQNANGKVDRIRVEHDFATPRTETPP